MSDEAEKLEANDVPADAAPGKKTKKRSKKKLTKEERLALIREKERNGQELTANEVEELAKERERVQVAVQKHRNTSKQSDSSRRPSCPADVSDRIAKEILRDERGLRNPRVIEVCTKLAETAANIHKLKQNRYLYSHGVTKALEARKQKTDVMGDRPEIEDVWYPGSRIRRHEERALYDFAESWRPSRLTWDEGKDREEDRAPWASFDEWLEWRLIAQTDVFRFAKEILGMTDLDENLHGLWAKELFVQKDPTLLKEEYQWADIRDTLIQLSPVKQRLLVSARASFKSSYDRADIASWIVYFGGDIRIRLITATRPLADGFLKALRATFIVRDVNRPRLFQRLWPEFVLYRTDDQGSAKSFTSPMRRLDLIEPTVLPSSLDTEGQSGQRSDYQVYEDVAEISNSSTPEMRQKVVEKVDMLRRLNEPFGYTTFIGTPISSGDGSEEDPGDLYAVLLQREETATEKRLLYQNHPVWRVKSGVKKAPYDLSLTPDEVTITQPNRFSFGEIIAQLRENPKVARQQLLCEWVPDDLALLRCQFDEDLIRRYTKPRAFFQNLPFITSVLAVDQSYSTSKYADLSALVYGEVRRMGEKYIFVVCDVVMDRWKMSELALQIVLMIQRNNPQKVIIERSGAYEALQEQIQRTAVNRGVSTPHVYWKPTTGLGTIANKAARIKGTLEPLLAEGRLYHVSALWNDAAIIQLVKFDGISKSSSTKKDDYPDSLERAVAYSMPRTQFEQEKSDPKAEEEECQAAHRRLMYNRIFGVEFQPPKPAEPAQPQAPRDPRDAVFGNCGLSVNRKPLSN